MTTERSILGPVDSIESLMSVVKAVSAVHQNSLILFRGQNSLHPTLSSGLSRPDVRYEPDVDRGLSAIAGDILGHTSVTAGNTPFRKAVLQHYGYKTHYIDLTADPGVAAWFACNKLERRPMVYAGAQMRTVDRVRYARRSGGLGYVIVLAMPDAEMLKTGRRLFDISTLEPFIRPSRQRAWLLLDRKPCLRIQTSYGSQRLA